LSLTEKTLKGEPISMQIDVFMKDAFFNNTMTFTVDYTLKLCNGIQ